MDNAKRIARWLQRRGLLRYLPLNFLKHYVYPLTVRRERRPYDAGRFFDSWYSSAADGELSDRITIAHDCDPLHARFHYNAVENGILRHFAAQPVRPASVLDIGSGAGHWIDFYRSVFSVDHVTAVEISEACASGLRTRYREDAGVEVIAADIASTEFELGRRFDIINAIGVMFHIVDDDRWRCAIHNLAAHLADDGRLVVGGQFGLITLNVHFHNSDDFSDWEEQEAQGGDVAYVDKRIRSRRRWKAAARDAGLVVEAVIKTPRVGGIIAPENNLMILRAAAHRSV